MLCKIEINNLPLINRRYICSTARHFLTNILRLHDNLQGIQRKNVTCYSDIIHIMKNQKLSLPHNNSIYIIYIITFLVLLTTACNPDPQAIRIAVTTDVHGMIFPFDLVERVESDHSLSHLHSYITEQRRFSDTAFFLLDNGDFLQGQPTVYYYNFIDTAGKHLSARVMNYLEYAAGTVGNHDIEAGPTVYNKIRREFGFPWLAANAISTRSGNPYFDPYTMLHAGNRRIAILGLITPCIPNWIPKNLWPEMEFRDMVESAQEWIPKIIEKENPDLVIGLFHSGTDAAYGGNSQSYLNENAVMLVAKQVPGFDLIFAGHDHNVSQQWVRNITGDSVLIVDPGSHARFAGEVTVIFSSEGNKKISSRIVPMDSYPPSEIFLDQFSTDYDLVREYLEDTITWLSESMTSLDALFGPSTMMSLIHSVQMELSGADLSFTAPLSLFATLEKGPVLVSDMFKLYRFENMLYRMELSGVEIDAFLEYAAGIWFNTMTGPDSHLLQFSDERSGRLANPYYNFSSAAGIDYRIDVTKPPGERIEIEASSNGTPFSPDSVYQVAVNSYRGNGGGGHLTRGAGIPGEELANRITWSTDLDLRYYVMQYLSGHDTLYQECMTNWRLEPFRWAEMASYTDRKLLE